MPPTSTPCCTASTACGRRSHPVRDLIPSDEKTPSAVRSDPDAIERVGAEFHHILVVGAGHDAEQLDLLRQRQRLERHAHEIRPHIHFLRMSLKTLTLPQKVELF